MSGWDPELLRALRLKGARDAAIAAARALMTNPWMDEGEVDDDKMMEDWLNLQDALERLDRAESGEDDEEETDDDDAGIAGSSDAPGDRAAAEAGAGDPGDER